MRGLPDLAISQPLDFEGQRGEFLGQFLLFVHEVLVGVLEVLGDFLLLLSRRLEGFLGFGNCILGEFGEFLPHGFVFLQLLLQFGEKFLG